MAIADKLTELQATKTAIKTAIEGKGQDLTNVPFTDYAEKITAIESGGGGGVEGTSGITTIASGYHNLTIAHGLSKAPKLFSCFIKGYTEPKDGKWEVNLPVGFTYTDKIAVYWMQHSTSGLNIIPRDNNSITLPGIKNSTYATITVDDTNVYIKGHSSPWRAGDYDWEAFTW
jgi:hypothetical protein